MTETKTQYAVPGQHSGPGEHSLQPYDSPLYLPPQWLEVRAVMHQIGLTGSQVANLVGALPRTARKWVKRRGLCLRLLQTTGAEPQLR